MKTTRSQNRSTWVFFLLTFVFSWGFWGPAALAGQRPGMLAFLAGGSGPSLVGILCAFLFLDRPGREAFWNRARNLGRIGGAWWAVVVLLFPALIAIALGAYSLFGGEPLPAGATWVGPTGLANVFGLILSTLIAGPLSEELGWRGFAQSELQKRYSPLAASLILGVFWGLWHLPLFLMAGTTQGALGFGSASFYLFLVQAVALSAIMGWVFNNTRESTLAAILLHFTYNGTLTLLVGMGGQLSPGLFNAVAITVIAFACGTLVTTGPGLAHRTPSSGSVGL